jgi:XTP/dITP diphosphohydrolase
MQLVFATNNLHKIKEVQIQLPETIKLLSLEEVGITEEIPETSTTIEGNALQKAQYVAQKWGYSCFADDTGLEVEGLAGAPGVHSARYAGEQKRDSDNIRKLLHNLSDSDHRQAQFKTIIALVIGENQWLFEGICPGTITREPAGNHGFGYDPIFKPTGWEITFAQMSLQEKNQISHRGKAVQKLVQFLLQL